MPVEAEQGKDSVLRGPPDGVQHRVHGGNAPDLLDLRRHPRSVGQGSGAHFPNQLDLGGGGRGAEDLHAAHAQELNEQEADAAPRGMHEGALTVGQGRREMGEPIGGQSLHRQGGRDLEGDIVGKAKERVRRRERAFGVPLASNDQNATRAPTH